MLEHKSQPVLPMPRFVERVLAGLWVVILLILASLAVGTIGYRVMEHMTWIDAFYNASLILSGMGPASELKTEGGKIFASLYSIYSGLFLIAATGLLLSPIFHRVMHSLHAER